RPDRGARKVGWRSRMRRERSASVAHDTTGFDIEGRRSDSKPRLIAERACKLHESLRVAKVAGQAERDPDGAGALTPSRRDDLEESLKGQILANRKRGSDVLVGNALGRLSSARITEAARAERNALLAGKLLHASIVEQVAGWIVKIHRDDAAS